MVEWNLQFAGSGIKKLQEEMISALSDLYEALKEAEAEGSYLLGVWKGEAAGLFQKTESELLVKANECSEKTEHLLMGLLQAEQVFTGCEAEVADLTKEGFLWDWE